jgi:hypothetical protein
MGKVNPAAAAAKKAKQYATLASDNDKALKAIEARQKALQETSAQAQEALKDPDLGNYPDAKTALEKCRDDAAAQSKVLQEEAADRKELADAIAAKDDAAIKAAQAKLTKLRSANPSIYGKGGALKPLQPCPKDRSTVACDQHIVHLKYSGYGGPGSPTGRDEPCFGTTLDEWPPLADMVKSGCLTSEERSIVEAMAGNEGAFESVQSYDPAALTAGAMQKTMASDGKGELTTQLSEFQAKNPAKFKTLFADKGWTIVGDKLTYTNTVGKVSKTYTGSDFSTWVRSTDKASAAKALTPFRTAGRDDDFRKKQICDFIDRLHDSADKSVTIGKNKVASGDILTSTQGKALLLDTSVNAGPNSSSFQSAVTKFYAANPKASKDPSTWSAADRETYEAKILQNFTSTRGVTDRPLRNKNLSGLSATPNPSGTATARPATTCPDC